MNRNTKLGALVKGTCQRRHANKTIGEIYDALPTKESDWDGKYRELVNNIDLWGMDREKRPIEEVIKEIKKYISETVKRENTYIRGLKSIIRRNEKDIKRDKEDVKLTNAKVNALKKMTASK